MAEYVIDLDDGLYTEQEWFEIINGRSRVIRCKDCKHWYERYSTCCDHGPWGSDPDGFCAWGEPRK